MKKILFILILLIPFVANADTIYNSILRDNEVRELPSEYNIFACVTRNGSDSDPEYDGTCIIEENGTADHVPGYTDEIDGLYPFEDDKGKVYFFRGLPNNWVQLGSYEHDTYYYYVDSISNYKTGTYEQCQNEASTPDIYCTDMYKIASKGDFMYWRIIRTNGDKSVRLIYAGTKTNEYDDKNNIGSSAFNIKQDELKYAGYTYKENGIEVDSALKTYIEIWYNNNNNTFKKYVVKSTFVNDTSTVYQNCYGNKDTDLCFPGYTRLWYWSEVNGNIINPTLQKSNSNAGFGGDYTLDVGTVTGDEIIMSGGNMWGYDGYDYINPGYNYSPDESLYDSRILRNYSTLLALTPGDSDIYPTTPSDDPFGSNPNRQVEIIATNGCTFTEDVNGYYRVRPVISINGNTMVTGHGTEDDPYRIAFTENTELKVNDEANILKFFNEIDTTKEIIWTVEDESILEIKDNTIKAKKIGETKITATVLGISYTLNVKVTEIKQPEIKNPETKTGLIVFIIFVISTLVLVFFYNKKVHQ